MGKLEGKTAIVTGATSGMGREIAVLFAREGAAVIASGRDPARGGEVLAEIEAAGGRGCFLAGDVGEEAVNQCLVAEAVKRYGALHIISASAGMLGLGSITTVSLETWQRTFATNLFAVFYLLRHGIPEMQKAGSGSVVITASIAAFKGFPNHAAYCASKGALVPFVRQAAIDYGPAVRINAICPGPVDTPLIWDSAKAFPDPDTAVSDVARKTLLKRLGKPEDVACLALFLASDDSSWMTGASLTLDGGVTCG